MSRPVPSAPSAALVAAALLLGAAGLSACAQPRVDGPVQPIVLTDPDGVMRGPDEGAEPVSPAEPAPAGDPTPTPLGPVEQETRREAEPDDDPEPPPPPPPPPPPADDADDRADDDAVEEDDDSEDGDNVDDDEDDDSEDGDD